MDLTSSHHYTVVRASHRRGPHFITCLQSDANPAKLRTPGPIVDSTGVTCYWNTDDPQTSAMIGKWKKTLGKTVAGLLGLCEGKDDEDWRFTEFPQGYKLYRYIKGEREDTYLLGSNYVTKFRTANEFSPHLYWLCTTEPSKATRSECRCKYCSGTKSQTQVNSSLGLEKSARLSDTFEHKSASHNKRKAEEEMAKENHRKRTTSESVASRSTARPANKPNPARKSFPAHVINSAINGGTPTKKQTFQGPYVNKDRDRDLSELQCTFRQAELVWCKLEQPFDGLAEGLPDVKIAYWPAICEERVLKSLPEVSSVNPDSKAERSRKTDSEPSPLTLKVQQNYQWKVRLLGACDVYWKDESELLAYLNYPTPSKLFELPIHPTSLPHITDGHASDRPTISSFKTISDAITAFALSLQITVHIKKSFTLVDRYDITFLKRIEGQGAKLSPEEMQIIYEDSTLPWYQCLWWGAEKIWSGELVRLMVTAADLPGGLRGITPGPHPRCFFLKITGLYRSAQEKGMVKGSIFELVPLEQRAIDEAEKVAEFDESLFHPNLQHLHRYLPEPPAGYFFRRLTPLRKEHHLVLQHIAGRYYPPQSLAIPPASTIGDAAEFVPDSSTIEGRSLSMCGMTEGKWLHMHCETWVVDRKECFKAAEAAGERELINTVKRLTLVDGIKTKSVQVTDMSSDAGSDSRVALGVTSNPDVAMVVEAQTPAATAGVQNVEMAPGDLNQKFGEGEEVALPVPQTNAKQATDGSPCTDADQIPIAVTEASGPSVKAETKTTGEAASSSKDPTRPEDACADVNPALKGDGAVPIPRVLSADLVMQDTSGKQEDLKVTTSLVENVDAQGNLLAGPDPLTVSAGQPWEKSPANTVTVVGSVTEELAQLLPATSAPLSGGSLESGSAPIAPILTAISLQAPEVLPAVTDGKPSAAGLESLPAVTGNENSIVVSSGMESAPAPILAVDPHLSFDPALNSASSPASITIHPQPSMDPFLTSQPLLPVVAPQNPSAHQPTEGEGHQLAAFPDWAGLVASSSGHAGAASVTKEATPVISNLAQQSSLLIAATDLDAMGDPSQAPKTLSDTGYSADGLPVAAGVNEPFTLPATWPAGLPHAQPGLLDTSDETVKVAALAGTSSAENNSSVPATLMQSTVGFDIDASLMDSSTGSSGGHT